MHGAPGLVQLLSSQAVEGARDDVLHVRTQDQRQAGVLFTCNGEGNQSLLYQLILGGLRRWLAACRGQWQEIDTGLGIDVQRMVFFEEGMLCMLEVG